jgi:hypothetical protein
MPAGDLVTLSDLKAYLGGDLQSNDDIVLNRLISAASAFFVTACACPILSATYTELYDGKGGNRLYLRQYPVTGVTSLSIHTVPTPWAAAPGQTGWWLNGNVILLYGFAFTPGLANIAVTYTAGYATPPQDVAEAVMELAGLRYRGKERLGKTSEGLGGMATTSYAQRDVSPFVASVIARYTRANLA